MKPDKQLQMDADRFLDECSRIRFFVACGTPGRFQLSVPHEVALSIAVSDRVLKSRATDEFCTQSRNDVYRRFGACSSYMKDGGLAEEVEVIASKMRDATSQIADPAAKAWPSSSTAAVRDQLAWIIGIAAMSFRFGAAENNLYVEMANVLKDGHFVSGWRGDYPKGSLVIF